MKSRADWHAFLHAEASKRGLDFARTSQLTIYADRLLDKDLPIIFDLEHLSRLSRIRRGKLASMVYRTDRFYKHYRIAKRSGGWREIDAPTLILKDCQRWILHYVLERMPPPSPAHGFVRGRSIATNASLHIGKPLVINLDIKDFFPSIKWGKVFSLFRGLGYSKRVCFLLTALTTYRGALPQGAPTSPMLSNLIVAHLDSRLRGLAARSEFSYSRYADDITFSGNGSPASIVPVIRKILAEEGFHLNESKVRVMRTHKRQEVTGLVVNKTASVRRSHIRWLRQQIYYLRKFGLQDCRQHAKFSRKNTREFLYGHALFVKMTNRAVGDTFLTQLDSVDW